MSMDNLSIRDEGPATSAGIEEGSVVSNNDDALAPADEPVDEHVPLPYWFQRDFPLLTKNEIFRSICDFCVTLATSVLNSCIVVYFFSWCSIFFPLFLPSIRVFLFSLWLVKSVFIKPLFLFYFKIASILGITRLVYKFYRHIVALIDFILNSYITVLGLLYRYVVSTWSQVGADYKLIWNQLLGEASHVLKTVVRSVKFVYCYVINLYKYVLPRYLFDFVANTVSALFTRFVKLVNFALYFVNLYKRAIQIIIDTWKEHVCGPITPAKRPQLVTETSPRVLLGESKHTPKALLLDDPAAGRASGYSTEDSVLRKMRAMELNKASVSVEQRKVSSERPASLRVRQSPRAAFLKEQLGEFNVEIADFVHSTPVADTDKPVITSYARSPRDSVKSDLSPSNQTVVCENEDSPLLKNSSNTLSRHSGLSTESKGKILTESLALEESCKSSLNGCSTESDAKNINERFNLEESYRSISESATRNDTTADTTSSGVGLSKLFDSN